MNNKFSAKLSLSVLVLALSIFAPRAIASQEALVVNDPPGISMDLQDASLKDVLKILSMQSGVNFISSEGVQDRKITLYLDNVPMEQARRKIFDANNLHYELDKSSNIFIVKDWGRPQVETVTKVFYLKNATVSSSSLKEELSSQIKAGDSGGDSSGGSSGGSGGGEGGKWSVEDESGITKVVKKLLSEYGSVVEDFRTNSLIVTDVPIRIAVISEIISSLDIAVPQVLLEVEMLDVNKNKVDKIGVKFMGTINASSYMFTSILTGAVMSTAFPISQSFYADKSFAKTFTPGSMNFSTPYNVYLDFIKQQSDTKILARPRILTLNNETAEIKIATQEAIGTITVQEGQGTSSSTTTSAERVETGVHLRVTPQINPDNGEITMVIKPIVSDATTSVFNALYKDPEVRSTTSVVRIKDGETVIIGGLIRNDSSETVTKLPILGDIPILGKLFTHKFKDKDRERELLVFITPRIMKDSNLQLAQAKQPSLPEREQGVAMVVRRQDIIDASLNNFENKY